MRKQEIFQVADEGRDKGKRFVLTEMPALKAERWAFRAFLALAHAGAEIPAGAGMAELALAGLQALQKLSFEEARPLLDEMWSCVKIFPDPRANPDFARPLVMNELEEGDDIEELATIWEIRTRVFKLHTDFFFNARGSKTSSGSTSSTTSPGSSSTPTSPAPSARSSRPGRPR